MRYVGFSHISLNAPFRSIDLVWYQTTNREDSWTLLRHLSSGNKDSASMKLLKLTCRSAAYCFHMQQLQTWEGFAFLKRKSSLLLLLLPTGSSAINSALQSVAQ